MVGKPGKIKYLGLARAFFCLALGFFIIVSALLPAGAYWVRDDDMDYKINRSFIADDYPLLVGKGDFGLPEELADTEDNMLNSQNFYTPSLLYADASWLSSGGVIVAAVERASDTDTGGKTDIAARRSVDMGEGWSPLKLVLSMPLNAASKSGGWNSACCANPSMVQASDGSIVMLFNMYPESKGSKIEDSLEDTEAYVELDGKTYMALYADSYSNDGKNSNKNGEEKPYTIREYGWVYAPDGRRMNYYVPQIHSGEYNYATIGDMYYAVGGADYIDTAPPLVPSEPEEGDTQTDIYAGNIYLNYAKPAFDEENPIFAQKVLASPWKEGEDYSPNSVYRTLPAPLRAAVSSYLWVMKSYDGGETWKQPENISVQAGLDGDKGALSVCPGTGLRLKNQANVSIINRLIFPLCVSGKAAFIYSDDDGLTWGRTNSGYMDNIGEVQCVELDDGTIMSFGTRSSSGKTPVSVSLDGGNTWNRARDTGLVSSDCQKSIIALPVDNGFASDKYSYPQNLEKGKQYLLVSHPSGKGSGLSGGLITLGIVKSDYSIEWLCEREIKTDEKYKAMDRYEDYFAASSLVFSGDGNMGLLYEAFPGGYLVFSRFNLDWVTDGGSPVAAVSKISPALMFFLVFLMLLLAAVIIFDVRRRRRLVPDGAEYGESMDTAREYSDDFPGSEDVPVYEDGPPDSGGPEAAKEDDAEAGEYEDLPDEDIAELAREKVFEMAVTNEQPDDGGILISNPFRQRIAIGQNKEEGAGNGKGISNDIGVTTGAWRTWNSANKAGEGNAGEQKEGVNVPAGENQSESDGSAGEDDHVNENKESPD